MILKIPIYFLYPWLQVLSLILIVHSLPVFHFLISCSPNCFINFFVIFTFFLFLFFLFISWALPNSPRPSPLTKLESFPGLFTPRTLELASTPRKELQRLSHHGLPCLPWPQLSVWTELSLRTVFYSLACRASRQTRHACQAGEDQGGHQRHHVWPRGAA